MSKKDKKEKVDETTHTIDETQQQQNVDAEEQNEATENATAQDQNSEISMQDKIDELNDKYLRLYSEFDNFRRRTSKEKIDLITSAGESVIKDMLSTLDDFERAIEHNEKLEDIDAIKEGFKLIYNKLFKTLENKGLKGMDSKGNPFDTELHEAVTNFPVEDEDQKGKVFDVVEKGYFLNDKVLRHAKVVVGQ